MRSYWQRVPWLVLLACYFGIGGSPCRAADLTEIVHRATAALNSDWASDPLYACIERDEVQKGEKLTSKTFEVVMIDGSDYRLPLAIDDQPLSPDRQKAELIKLKNEVRRRKSESPSARRARIDAWKKQRDENGELLLDFPTALTFQLQGEETKNGHPAYVLSAAPIQGVAHTTRAAKVLSGMEGKVWVERDTLHPMFVECTMVTAVPVYGALASVLPGTEIEIKMIPVTDSIWLIDEVSMKLNVSKLHIFKSSSVKRSTYTQHRLNSTVVEELLSKADQESPATTP
ncbi:MAG: hypothetical protein JWO80_444 [Bryobacterales bacterium]|nr:hypothetical protein [Bryobacterales bacterium]